MTVPIDPRPQVLTPNEQRAKAILDAGGNEFDIAARLRISYENARDLIYRIRKKSELERLSREHMKITERRESE